MEQCASTNAFCANSNTPLAGKHRRRLPYYLPSQLGSTFLPKILGGATVGRVTSICEATLPEELRFQHVADLMIPLRNNAGNGLPVPAKAGELWEVYPADDDITPSQFEQLCQNMPTRLCTLKDLSSNDDAWEAVGCKDIDWDEEPSSSQTTAATHALETLSEQSKDANTCLIAKLVALHLSATDMEFIDLLAIPAMATMAAAALEGWTAREPLFFSDACQAQDSLASVVGYALKAPSYVPFWKVAPFEFKSSHDIDRQYDQEVLKCAPAYVKDSNLKAIVCSKAHRIFQQLDEPMFCAQFMKGGAPCGKGEVYHKGLIFKIICSLPEVPPPSVQRTAATA